MARKTKNNELFSSWTNRRLISSKALDPAILGVEIKPIFNPGPGLLLALGAQAAVLDADSRGRSAWIFLAHSEWLEMEEGSQIRQEPEFLPVEQLDTVKHWAPNIWLMPSNNLVNSNRRDGRLHNRTFQFRKCSETSGIWTQSTTAQCQLLLCHRSHSQLGSVASEVGEQAQIREGQDTVHDYRTI